MVRTRSRLRLGAVRGGFLVATLVLIGRAAFLQLVEGERYREIAESQRTEQVELPAPRGAIYDRNRVPLSLTQSVYHVGVAPQELINPDLTVELVSKSLNLSAREVRSRFGRDYAYFHGPYTSRDVQELRNIRGIYLTPELSRFYPNPTLARAVVGRPSAPGRPASGIERVFDSLLAGNPGHAVVLRDQVGRQYQSPARLDAFPTTGFDVYLTIDADLQDIVERSLAVAIDRLDAAGGDVVVMDPRTGDLLAVAARRADGSLPPSPFTSVFEPGSTAKLFTAAALLEHRLVQPSDSVWGENGRYEIGSRVVEDEHPEGWLTLSGVIRRSSNIGIAKFGELLSSTQLYEALRDFGLGSPSGVEFPVEAAGILHRPEQWSSASRASLSIGYEVAVTMIQLAAAYSAIANDGLLPQPTLVASIRNSDGMEIYRRTPRPVRRVFRDEVARELRDMLRAAVEEEGTGATAALVRYEVAGKTGTARRAGPNGYIPGSHTASFASMFPAHDPQLVMVVKLDDPTGGYASSTAAPLTRSVLEQLLATQTGVLDRGKLGAPPAQVQQVRVMDPGIVPYVVSWPPRPEEPQEDRRIPNVRGVSVREAARRLHEQGFRVRLVGWGTVRSISPEPGTPVHPGTLVRIEGNRSIR
ncbi:MAG: transpeptidase family protein [Gemmatimonadota bacterium]|nr:transpeptidase family protein [Gemmatimonadota bacterium]